MTDPQNFFGKDFDEIERNARREAELKNKEAEEARKKRAAELEESEEKRSKLATEQRDLLKRLEADQNLEIGNTLKAIVELEDFLDIRRNFNSIPTVVDKIGYIHRVVYERTQQGGVFMDPQKTTLFNYRLKDIGMPLLCPYLRLEGANKTTHEDCTIDSEQEPTMALCQGRYDICVVFKERTTKAALGQFRLRIPQQVQDVDPDQECLVDLDDLNDWWQGEGKYD